MPQIGEIHVDARPERECRSRAARGRCVTTPRIVNGLAGEPDLRRRPSGRAPSAAPAARARRGPSRSACEYGWPPASSRRAVERKPVLDAAQLDQPDVARALPRHRRRHRLRLDDLGAAEHAGAVEQRVELRRAALVRPRARRLHDDVGADEVARLARERRSRTFCTTLRSTTMAATPSATQRKKNSSRAQDGARLAPRHAEDEHHADASCPGGRAGRCRAVARRRGRRAARSSRRRAPRARRSCVTSTSVRPRSRLTAHEQIDDLPAGGAVEIAGRLVGEQDRRIVGERARDRDALLLAARELRRIVMPAVRQPDVREQRRGRAPARRARRRSPSARGRSRAPSATGAGGRTERRCRLSRRAARASASSLDRRDVDAVEQDAARRRRVEPRDEAEQRGLAAARRPGDRHRRGRARCEATWDAGWSAGPRRSSRCGRRRSSSIIDGHATAADLSRPSCAASDTAVSAMTLRALSFGWMPSA